MADGQGMATDLETVPANFWTWAKLELDRLAVVEVDGTEVTFGSLAERVHATAHALLARGLRPGDCVATMLRNRSECYELFLAALTCGWYFVPINHHGTVDDVWWVLDNAEVKALFVESEFADRATAAADQAGLPDSMRFSADRAPGFETWADLRRDQRTDRPDRSVAGQVMQYTSGTTGRPKGVRRPIGGQSADEAVTSTGWLLRVFGMAPGEGAHLVTAPIYHSAVHSTSIAALHFGQTLVLMERWTPEACLDLIERHRISSSHMVATHFHRLLQLPEAHRSAADVSSLTHVIHGAVPTPVVTKALMIDWWGPVIHEYYGSSEVGGTYVSAKDWLRKPGTVGVPFSISELRILDDQGAEVPVGEVGSIWMRQGDQQFSYYKDTDKTSRSTRGQFIHVGDYGYVDEEGYLFLAGRDAEIIISGGVNIYPAAVEGRLLQHPFVRDCGVIGVPNAEFGEEVKAVVSLIPLVKPGPETEAALIEHCRQGLSHIVCPRSVDFVDELERDPSGKMRKRALRDRYWPTRVERA